MIKPKAQLTAPWVIALMGPTSSGKTKLAIELSEKFPISLINVDSSQVYRGFNIGSGKPSKDVLLKYPHALMDIVNPTEPYSAHQFCVDARIAIDAALANGRIPLLVGGTMLYFKALIQGMAPLPGASQEVRQELESQALVHGWPYMHQLLAEVDAETALRLKPFDAQRIQRALEIYQTTSKPMSYWLAQPSTHEFPYQVLNLALLPKDSERARLHQLIADRFHQMLDEGFIAEVEALLSNPLHLPSLPAFRAVGYRQVIDYLEGSCSYSAMIEKAIASTRQLAKRQLTWLRSWPNCIRIDCFSDSLHQTVMDSLDLKMRRHE